MAIFIYGAEPTQQVQNYTTDKFCKTQLVFKRPYDDMLDTLLYRLSYMSARVLLNLLNKLGNRDKMRGLLSILSLFCNEFNKFNNTRA